MAVYISEISYKASLPDDFIEVAATAGTDLTGYTIAFYNGSGKLVGKSELGTVESTNAGMEVYSIDETDPNFVAISKSGAVALVDDLGNVIQFISFNGNVITPTEGPAAGLTSTSIGTAGTGESLQSDDGGASYYGQPIQNPGTIPCYAPGTLIDTPNGPRAVETLCPGDLVITLDHGPQPIKWVRAGDQPLETLQFEARPVLIQAGALGPDRPVRNLIVSPQHRILVGALGQLDGLGEGQAFAPAKALTDLPHIRFMRGKRSITWIHFACTHHEVVFANGCASESLLLGPMVLNALSRYQRRVLHRLFGPQAAPDAALNGPPARPCLTVGAVRNLLCNNRDPVRAAA